MLHRRVYLGDRVWFGFVQREKSWGENIQAFGDDDNKEKDNKTRPHQFWFIDRVTALKPRCTVILQLLQWWEKKTGPGKCGNIGQREKYFPSRCRAGKRALVMSATTKVNVHHRWHFSAPPFLNTFYPFSFWLFFLTKVKRHNRWLWFHQLCI